MAESIRFIHPPVREVTLTVWFDSLRTLSALHLSQLRIAWMKSFPNVEEVAPFAPMFPGESGLALIGRHSKWPMPACVFSSLDRDRSIVVQDDRFALTWRLDKKAEYPGFPILHDEFTQKYNEFIDAIMKANNPNPKIQQVTIEYENHLEGVDPQDAAIAVLTSVEIPAHTGQRPRDSVSIRKHYCSDDDTDVSIILAIDPAAPEATDSAEFEENSGESTVISIHGFADVEKEQDFSIRLTHAHDAVIRRFVAITSESARKKWGEIS